MKYLESYKDSSLFGVLVALGGELLTALLLWAGLLIASQDVMSHLRWFAVCFVPPILMIRFLAKSDWHPKVCKAVIVVLFVTFVAFMVMLFKTKSIVL